VGEAFARRFATRAARGLGWALLALCVLVLLVAFGLPLIVRGPVLARLVEHESNDLCGTVRVAGGHVSLGLAPALLSGRPFDVVLRGTRIREPDGNALFRARTVRARLAVHRNPWRVVVEHALVSDGAWRLVDEDTGEPITQALRKIPPGGRDACRIPAAPEPPPGGRPIGSLVTVQAVTLRHVSVLLSFPSWAVALDDVDAHGTVDVRSAREGAQVLFDARDITTRKGGSLRVGPRNEATPVFPFDHVDIPRVAVTSDVPQDLLLTVAEARTADAVLSGHARFTNAFAPKEWNAAPGMELTARWTDIGRPLERNERWADVGKGLADQRTGVVTSLRGPFDTLTGIADIRGRNFSVRADLRPGARYALDVRLDKFDTTPFVPRDRRALLAGRLDGRLALSARLDPAASGPAASLDDVELVLQRTHTGRAGGGLPGRWVVSRSFRPRAADELRVDVGDVAFGDGALRIDAFRVAAPSVQFAGRARAERHARSGELTVNLWPQAGSRFAWRGETFLPPAVFAARVEPGRAVTVDRFTVQHVGGGAIDVGGKVRFDGRLDVQAAVRAYPLARIPGVAAARAPGRNATVGALLRGQLDAALAVAGRPQRPSLSGTLALSKVAWAGHDLGGGRIQFAGLPGGTRFDGQLLDGIDVRGTLHQSLKAQDEVAIALHDLPLRWWLPSKVAPLDPRASGEINWQHAGDREEVRVPRLVVSAKGATADAKGVVRLDRDDPRASPVDVAITARVDGRALTAVLLPKDGGAGVASIDAAVSGTIGAPLVRAQAQLQGLTVNWPQSPFGAVRLDGPVRIEGRTLSVGPLQASLQSGGRLQIGGARGAGTVVLTPQGASLPVKDVDLTIQGSGITTARAIGGLSLNGLSLGVRMIQPSATALQAGGWVSLGRDFFQLNHGGDKNKPKQQPGKPAGPAGHRPSLADHIQLRLRVVGPKNAMTVGIPYAPDVTVDPDCLVQGPLTSPRISGSVKGTGVYSRVALAVADWFTSRNLRGCDLGSR
jgi:hypothetical protein